MAAPTQACNVKILLANPEPSTHGTNRTSENVRFSAASRNAADMALIYQSHTSMPISGKPEIGCTRLHLGVLPTHPQGAGAGIGLRAAGEVAVELGDQRDPVGAS